MSITSKVAAALLASITLVSCNRTTQDAGPAPGTASTPTKSQSGEIQNTNGSGKTDSSTDTNVQTATNPENPNPSTSSGDAAKTVNASREGEVTSTSTPDTTPVVTKKICLEELQSKFGPDIVFPAQQLFPKQYEAVRSQGAGGQTALKTLLESGTCDELKAKE